MSARPTRPSRLRAAGERIDALLDASASGGVVARERAEELVRLMADLYGAGIERMLDLLYEPAGWTTRCSRRSRRTTWSRASCSCTVCTPTTWPSGWRKPWRASGPISVRTAVTSSWWA